MLCAKFSWNWPSGSAESDFLISSMYFLYYVIISPWKRAWPFIWTNLNPLHPRMLCAKFGWNWPSGSGEEDEHVKSLQTDRQTDGQTDAGRQVIRKAHLSFQLTWAKNGASGKNLIKYIYWLQEKVTLNWKLSPREKQSFPIHYIILDVN